MADVAIPRAKPQMTEAGAWAQLKHNRNWLGFWFMVPAMVFLIFFLAYPLGLGIWLSFTDTRIGRVGQFIAFENYEWLWDDSIFWLSVFNTLLYTFVASAFKFGIGLYLALLLNEHMPFKAMLRAMVLIPFIVPTVLSALALLVDLRLAILDHLLVAEAARPDQPEHQLPRRHDLGTHLRDLRQYLARRAVRGDHAARRPADRLALAL
ncbi:ABC-type spermidine/putrescine transport system permease subunit I [Bradyrhizobium yuanmingense]|uniref:ABC-type spermidine/putrescine transport system permease subunit I n=1 Tax=Bradyrhizobium yuanmingense TaxID=108015 RepID=A0ABV4GVX0_9BRAD